VAGSFLLRPFRWSGTVGRAGYAAAGVSLFAIKYNIDRLVAQGLRNRPWQPLDYLFPLGDLRRAAEFDSRDYALIISLIAVAAPFIWIGVGLTVRRLRSIGLPIGLAALFFVPFVNLVFFALLCTLPPVAPSNGKTARPERILTRTLPRDEFGSGAFALLFTIPLGLVCIWLGVKVFKEYGWAVFVVLPFVQGLVSVLIYSYRAPRTRPSCFKVAMFSIAFLGLATVIIAVEGLICVLMAAPLAALIALAGAELGYEIQSYRHDRPIRPGDMLALFLLIPLIMGAEKVSPPDPALHRVTTTVEIDSPPQRVWDELIAFSEMTDRPNWLFRMGIAYPVRAEIRGRGPGAVRYCVFSTGAFVEPIEVWDEPRLLKFSVAEQPLIMREWSPYRHIETAHLDYFRSRQGQFLLEPTKAGGTRLAGTTWYEHTIFPAAYWRLWSDLIIHRIHERVLKHIKSLAEDGKRGETP
jgi:hypothetical protein